MSDLTNQWGNGAKILYSMEFPCGIIMRDWLTLRSSEQDALWQEHKARGCPCTNPPSEYSGVSDAKPKA